MKADIRRDWEYRGHKVVRVDCQHPTWGKGAEPIRFRTAYRNRYWRIEFHTEPFGVGISNKTWVHVEFKADARKYIDAWESGLDIGRDSTGFLGGLAALRRQAFLDGHIGSQTDQP